MYLQTCSLFFSFLFQSFRQLDSSPYFFFDAMYVHEPQSPENRCEVSLFPVPAINTEFVNYIPGNWFIPCETAMGFWWLLLINDFSVFFFASSCHLAAIWWLVNIILLQEIFDRLCDLDEKGMSYIFEAARNPTRLYDQMAKLLAHPLQRPLQSEIAYRLHNIADLTDTWYLSSVQCKAVTCHEILTS